MKINSWSWAEKDDPMFTGATIVSGIIRPVLSKKERKVKPKKKVKGDKKQNSCQKA